MLLFFTLEASVYDPPPHHPQRGALGCLCGHLAPTGAEGPCAEQDGEGLWTFPGIPSNKDIEGSVYASPNLQP